MTLPTYAEYHAQEQVNLELRLHAIEEELANLLDRRAVVDDALATIDARIAAALDAHVAAENAELMTTVEGRWGK